MSTYRRNEIFLDRIRGCGLESLVVSDRYVKKNVAPANQSEIPNVPEKETQSTVNPPRIAGFRVTAAVLNL